MAVARGDHILLPPGILAPKLLYPKGRVDPRIVEEMVVAAVEGLAGKRRAEAWQQFLSPADQVGIMVDVGPTSVELATIEVIIDQLVEAGVDPDRICVFGGDEGDLFEAGFTLRREGPGVRTYGAESEGYRGGISRIPADHCQVIINVATLRADAELGMAGCVANYLACVPNVERRRLRAAPALLPAVAAHPALRTKVKLNFLEAYQPLLDAKDESLPPVRYRGLIVGTDPVAVDVIGARVLRGCRDEARKAPWPLQPEPTYLQAAHQDFRVGQADPTRITVRLLGAKNGSYLE